MNPTISIITPVYNAERFIEETIQSVISQSYTDWEWILVDDCSKDDSSAIIEEYTKTEPRISFIKLEQNSGTGIAKNTAIRKARGRYIAFIDSDDVWFPDKLEKQFNFMQHGNYPISFTAYKMIDKDGNSLNQIVPVVESLKLKQYLKNTLIGFSTSMVDRKLTGDFEIINLRSREDTHLWIDLLGRGLESYGLNEVLVKYRIHDSSITTNKLKAAKQTWELYYRVEKFGLLRSLYYFSHYAYRAFKKHYI